MKSPPPHAAAMTPIPQLITKIRHFGTNVLGALLMAANVGLLCLAVFNAESVPKPLTAVMLTCSYCVPIAFDFLWRYYSEPRDSMWRLVFPGSGGVFFFFPIWITFLAVLIGMGSMLTLAALKVI
jgi:hypothetical protein